MYLAFTEDCEASLGRYVLANIERGELPSERKCQRRFGREATVIPLIRSRQHILADYDQLLNVPEVSHG
jgi:hypothetical protein